MPENIRPTMRHATTPSVRNAGFTALRHEIAFREERTERCRTTPEAERTAGGAEKRYPIRRSFHTFLHPDRPCSRHLRQHLQIRPESRPREAIRCRYPVKTAFRKSGTTRHAIVPDITVPEKDGITGFPAGASGPRRAEPRKTELSHAGRRRAAALRSRPKNEFPGKNPKTYDFGKISAGEETPAGIPQRNTSSTGRGIRLWAGSWMLSTPSLATGTPFLRAGRQRGASSTAFSTRLFSRLSVDSSS